MNTLGEEVKRLRAAAGLSQGKLADELGLAQPFLSHIENGTRGIPARRLFGFARLLGVSVDHFQPFMEGFKSTRKPVVKGKKSPAKRRAKA